MKQKFDGSVIWKKGGFEFETIIRKMYVLIVLWIAHGVAVTYPNRPWMDIFADLHYKFVPASATHICIYILYTHIYIYNIYYIYIYLYTHTSTHSRSSIRFYTKDNTAPKNPQNNFPAGYDYHRHHVVLRIAGNCVTKLSTWYWYVTLYQYH